MIKLYSLYAKTPKTISLLGGVFVLALLFVVVNPSNAQAATKSAAYLAARLPDARNTIIAVSQGCREGIQRNHTPGPFGTTYAAEPYNRTHVNNSGGYSGWIWASAEGNPTAAPILATSQTSVRLQLNQWLYHCAYVVRNSGGGRTDGGAYVTSSNYPNDRAPQRSDSTGINNAAKTGDTNKITRITDSCPGGNYVTNLSNTTMQVYRDSGLDSRYSFSPNHPTFTFNRPASCYGEITITVYYRGIGHFYSQPPAGGACWKGSVWDPTVSVSEIDSCNEVAVTTKIYIEPPEVTVSGRVFNVDTGAGISGVVLTFCRGSQTATTNSTGNWSTQVPQGGTYCVKVASGGPATAPVGPRVRPTGEGYKGVANCPAFTSAERNPNYCATSSYECQRAGSTAHVCGPSGTDRSADTGLQIVYTSPSCGTMTVSPSVPEPGQPFNVTLAVDAKTSGSYTYTVRLNHPGLTYSGANPKTGGYPSPTPALNTTFTGLVAPVAGNYSGSFVIGAPINLTCTFGTNSTFIVIPVRSKPFLQAFRGDVIAGSSLKVNSVCTPYGSGGINTFNEGSGSYKGSGSQLGVFARGTIAEFISASLRIAAPTKPKALSFTSTSGAYGGSFTSLASRCLPDYFSAATAPLGNTTIPGKSITADEIVYVDGDLTITGNIVYGAASWATTDAIPNIRYVVRGNIYISNNVTELNGTYIAVPRSDGSAGEIYACSPTGSVPTRNQLKSECIAAPQLRFFGAVLAKTIHLHRLRGTAFTERPVASSPLDYGNTNAAEVFIESPLHWLTKPSGSAGGGSGEYESISNLPPVL